VATVTAMTAAATQTALDGKVDKGSLVYNVMDYGAVGDAFTSNDTAFADAISAVTSSGGGGIVFVPPGNYLLTSTASLTLSADGTTLRGAGPEATRIMIGGTFTGTAAVTITGQDCIVEDITIAGANSSSTPGNPVVDAIYVYGGKHAKIDNCTFQFINSWCIEAVSDSSGNNPDGLMISRIFAQQCSAGFHLKGNSPNSYIYHGQVSDIWLRTMGVTTGAGANMDGLFIEDAQDLEFTNVNLQMANGTGSNLHIKGAIRDLFMVNVRSTTNSAAAANCLIEDSAGGSPTNVQIENGVFQYGVIGLRVTGAASSLFVRGLRITDCQTHGVSIEGSGNPINLLDLGLTANGSGSSGTNYEINWSGTSTGVISDCRFSSSIVASGSNGVQKSINIAASGQKVRCINTRFEGSGAAASNWVTNTPSVVADVSSTNLNYTSTPNYTAGLTAQAALAAQPSSSANTILSSNQGGVAANDNFRLAGDGTMTYGIGTSARDTTWKRLGTAQVGTSDSDIIIGLAGKGLRVKEGTNARQGTATLVAGTVTVSNTSTTANTRIILGSVTPGGTPGALFVNAHTVGTSFVIKSTSSTDTSVVSYLLVEAA